MLVVVAILLCMALNQYYFRCQVARPSVSSLSANAKALHAKENVIKQKISNKEKPRAINGVSGTLPTNGGIWHGNYTMKDNTGTKLVGFWQILNKSYVEEHLDRPQVGDHICEDVLCSEFLTEKEVDRCAHGFIKNQQARKKRKTLVPTCHFINGTSRASNVALISFPGSGNTWTRGLLEKATGICTGDEHKSHFNVYVRLRIMQALCIVTCLSGCQALLVKASAVAVFW